MAERKEPKLFGAVLEDLNRQALQDIADRMEVESLTMANDMQNRLIEGDGHQALVIAAKRYHLIQLMTDILSEIERRDARRKVTHG